MTQLSFDNLTERSIESAGVHHGWCNFDNVFVEGSEAFILDNDLKTVNAGPVANVELWFKTGTVKNLHPRVVEILSDIKRMEEGVNGNKPKIKRTSDIRSRPSRNFEHRKGTIRHSPAAKRTPVHPAKFP